MPNIFNANIAQELLKAMGSLVFDLTLTRITGGYRTTGNPTGKTPITEDVSGKGFVDDYKAHLIDGTIIRHGDRKVVILGASIPVAKLPRANDTVTIEGETKKIISVVRDPAGATYECQVR